MSDTANDKARFIKKRKHARDKVLQVTDLDAAYGKYVENFEDHLDPIECNILRIATYEFLHHLEIPYKVVINEAINLAKTYGADESHKFVNGVLDPLALEMRQLETAG